MQTQITPESRVRRTFNELVVAELLLVQATIESAAVIGDGLSELGKQIAQGNEAGPASWDDLSIALQRIADEALESYTSRISYLRDRGNSDS